MEPTPSSACAAAAVSARAPSSKGSEPTAGLRGQGFFGAVKDLVAAPRISVTAQLIGAVVSALVLAAGLSSCSTSTSDAGSYALEPNATVVRVVDGDTIVVRSEGEEERVRLIGINTPESVDPSRPVMCYGKEASAHMADVLKAGTKVQLKRDVEARDRYERLLAYVYRASDGLFVNLEMVTSGYANQYRFPPNVAHEEQFSKAAGIARQNGVGLWSACDKPFEE